MSTSSDEQLSAQSVEIPVEQPAASQVKSLWRNRDYLLLWSGQMVSSVGTQVSGLAFPLLALLLTGSPAQAGFMGALRALPYLFLSLPVGALVDRWDRKRVMILCDSGRAITLGSIPLVYALFGTVPVAQLYLAALVEGTLFVFFNIAEVACLPRVGPPPPARIRPSRGQHRWLARRWAASSTPRAICCPSWPMPSHMCSRLSRSR
jgi:MFS family permease